MVAAFGRSTVRRLDPAASLAALWPAVAAQWHPTRNLDTRAHPHTVSARAGLIVWWRCPNGHEWEQSIAARTGSTAAWNQGDPAACRRCHQARSGHAA